MEQRRIARAGVIAGWAAVAVSAAWLPLGVAVAATGFMMSASVSISLKAMDGRVQSALLAALLSLPHVPGRAPRLRVVDGQSAGESPTPALRLSDHQSSAGRGGR